MDIIKHILFLPHANMHPYKENNITDILTRLTPHMLTVNSQVHNVNQESVTTLNTPMSNSNTKTETELDNNPQRLDTVTPAQYDSLFWCMYIAIHKYAEYLMIHHKHNAIEMEWKQQLSKQVNEYPAKLKQSNHKVTKANIQELLSDFMTSPYKTNLLCVVTVTVYHNINIIIMNSTNNMRMEFIADSSVKDTYILHKNDRNHYSIDMEPICDVELEKLRNRSFLIENNEKPLKSIGTYKVDELVHYAKLFGLYNDHEKYKKNELYDLIGTYVAKYNLLI